MAKASTTRPLIPYLRRSRKGERTISIEDQRRDVQRWAKNAGVPLADEVVEMGVSGNKAWRERELGQAIEACKRGDAAGIIVAYRSRLSREQGLATYEMWTELESANLRLVCVSEGIDTAREDDQEFSFGVWGLMAREEWKRNKRNLDKGKRAAIENGVHIGTPPAGYTNPGSNMPLQKNGDAPAVLRAFEMRADGASLADIGRMLREAGVPGTRGVGRWGARGVAQLLSNQTYLGEVRCGEWVNREAHEPIVPRALFRKVKKLAGAPRGPMKMGSEGALLGGLLYCASCGYRLSRAHVHQRGNGKRVDYMTCKSNPACKARASISCAKIEPYVEAAFIAWLQAEQSKPIRVKRSDEFGALEEALAEAQEYADSLYAEVEAGKPIAPRFLSAATARVEEAQRALDAAEPAGGDVLGTPVELYEMLPVPDRRALITAWIERDGPERMHVHPGRLPVTEKVEWRVPERRKLAPVTELAA